MWPSVSKGKLSIFVDHFHVHCLAVSSASQLGTGIQSLCAAESRTKQNRDLLMGRPKSEYQNANLNRKKLAKEEEQVKVVVDSTGSIV